MKADTTFKPHDAVELVANFHFLSKGPSASANKAVMGITYSFTNDSVQGITRQIMGSGMQRLYLKADSAFEIRNVSGFIYYPKKKGQSSNLLIDNIRLTRYHSKELPSVPNDTLKAEPKPAESDQQ